MQPFFSCFLIMAISTRGWNINAYLSLDCIFMCTNNKSYTRKLLNPFKKEFYLPSVLIMIRHCLCWYHLVVGKRLSVLSVLLSLYLTRLNGFGYLFFVSNPLRLIVWSHRIPLDFSTGQEYLRLNRILFFERITKKAPALFKE